jgi:asparagine synthase (glutamine-hydrolysing)
MCGIAGYSATPGVSVPPTVLKGARVSLGHRGPDGFGEFTDPSCGIGVAHVRLAIIDISSNGHQPMFSPDGRVVLAFNGEIYNFREIREELISKGWRFNGKSDTEVLLYLYLEYRHKPGGVEGFLRRLNGIFAFVIFDSNVGELLLARDAFGVKPLYCSSVSGVFFFSSEIKSLLAMSMSVSDENLGLTEIDPDSLNLYLTYLWCPGGKTAFKNIIKLNPGEALKIRSGEILERITWYTLPSSRSLGKAKSALSISSNRWIAQTERHLRSAVQRQLISDVPVGAFLSGGLDSSSVVAFAREHLSDLRCFTSWSEGMQDEGIPDDLPYAQRAAKHLGVSLEAIKIDPFIFAAHVPEAVRALEEPLLDPAAMNTWFISELARRQGIKVLLSGVGADDLFGGYRRHKAVMFEHWWNWLPAPVLNRAELLSRRFSANSPWGRRLRRVLSAAVLSGDARLASYFKWANSKDLRELFTTGFRSELDRTASTDPILLYLKNLHPETGRLDRMLTLEQRFFLSDHNLLYTDKMSMAMGVEVRVPFLDFDLVEFAAEVPSEFKQRGLEGKWVLRKAMEPYLPYDVVYRKKAGFGVPLRRWMRVELRDWIMDNLSTEKLKNRGIFEPAAVHRLVRRNLEGQVDAGYTIFALVCIEIWCQNFLEKNHDW